MKIKFNKNITCDEPDICSANITEKIIAKYPKWQCHTKKQNGHLSILHQQNNHIIWFFAYDNNGIAETEDTNSKKTVTQNNPNVTKYTGITIKESDLKKLI